MMSEASHQGDKEPKQSQPDNVVVVEIKGLSKSFSGKVILKNIDLTLNKGENVVILGKSGGGKSVLIKCMVRLIDSDKGTLKVLGKDVNELKDKELNELRTQVGFLFQSAALYDSMTVRENLEFPLRNTKFESDEERDTLVRDALENVKLPDIIDKMPSELSGGMRKRLGLARTLILKPQVMLYDEPTTGLDPITSKEISSLILEMQKKYQMSSIIITHDIECARITANKIVILKEGVFIKEGTFDELKQSEDDFIRSFFE
ncbi:MAG: ATP-binding cassette domain-containing protein [Bacteroidia bacterium]|nr:ATP-binding cassette domain-containing protein [Bacteroidia bacterium]